MINPTIYTSRTVVMQRLADAVGNGYTQWCSGSLPAMRCSKFINKFELNYQVFADRNTRARRKRAGLGNAQLVLWIHQDQIRWWLIVTAKDCGNHAAHTTEKLSDALSATGRIQIDGFELVRLPKPTNKKDIATHKAGSDKKKATNRLTWRMDQKKYEDWRIAIIDAVRCEAPHVLHNLVYRLWSSPGFGGIRSQIGKVAALYKAEVKRASRKDAPSLPKRLGYVRRIQHSGIKMLQLIAQEKIHADRQRQESVPANR